MDTQNFLNNRMRVRNVIVKMMFGYKIKAMRKGCISCVQENAQDDVWHKGCVSYAQENAQDDVWV